MDNTLIQTKYKKVSSVASFLKEIQKIKESQGLSPSMFYRGEDQIYKHVQSALARPPYLFRYEYELINKAQLEFPEMFEDCHCLLEKIIKMQHFGLPTRLLDVTQNPLIALYFACQPSKDQQGNESDGRVLLINQTLTTLEQVNAFADLIPNITPDTSLEQLVRILFNKKIFSIDIFSKRSQEEQKQWYKECLFRLITQSFLFIPSYSNPRLKNQRGAFLFSSLLLPWNKQMYQEQIIKERIDENH